MLLVILFSTTYILVGAFYLQQTAFTTQKDFGREAREAAWAREQRTLHGLQTVETRLFTERHTFRDINLMAEEAKRRAEIARSVMLSQHTPLHTQRVILPNTFYCETTSSRKIQVPVINSSFLYFHLHEYHCYFNHHSYLPLCIL